MLITFANRLDPDLAGQNVGPDLDPACLTILMAFLKEFFENVEFEKISMKKKFPACKELNSHNWPSRYDYVI